MLLTIDDLHRHVLPLDTEFVAGMGGGAQPVGWVLHMHPHMQIDPDDLILSGEPVEAEVLRELAELGAAGLLVDELPSAMVIAEANLAEFPVLVLPPNSRLRTVEQEIVRAIVQADNETAEGR